MRSRGSSNRKEGGKVIKARAEEKKKEGREGKGAERKGRKGGKGVGVIGMKRR